MSGFTAMSVKNLSCGYDGTDIIKDISFDVKIGERLCIIGPNGSGKTTLLRALAGLLPYSGSIALGGSELKTLSRRQISSKVALFSQLGTVYFPYTVFETVALGRYLASKKSIIPSRQSRLEENEAVEKQLRSLGIWDIRDKTVTELSGGQLQRTLLARTFVQNPEIILLDEPTNHLDLKFNLELVEKIKEWTSNENKTAIGVIHDLTLASRLADTILLIGDGKTQKLSDASDVLNSQEINQTYGIDIADAMRKSLAFWNN